MRERPVLPWLGGLGVLLLLCVVWSGWRAYTVAQDLREVERNAEILRAAMVRGDVSGARSALENYQQAADSAEDGVSGPTWWTFEQLPIVGDDAEGIAGAAEVLAGIGQDGLPPLVDAAEDVTARTFHPVDGVFPLERIARLEQPARRSERAFDEAAQRLAELDSDGYYGPVRTQFEELATLVTEARSTLGAAYRAAQLMPALLGADGPRDHLLVMQNNAELRSSGGLPGSLSVIHAERGRVEIIEQTDMAKLEGTTEPVLRLTAEERELFGTVLGTYGVNATLTPDFERAADLIRARWELQMGSSVDGVFFVDPVAISYLLRATGPVQVPGHGAVDAGNVVAEVENEIYLRTPRPAEHSAYQNAVAKAVFDVFASGRGEPAELIRGLAAGVEEGRIRIHSFVPKQQEVIAGTAIAGEFPEEGNEEPHVGIYLNDGGETKMAYYLDYQATFTTRSCVGAVQDLVGSITFTNATPAHVGALPSSVVGLPKANRRISDGQQFVVAYLTSPIGGEFIEVDFGSGRREPAVQAFRGREVATVGIVLDPRETQTVEFRVRSARGQTGDAHLFVTPGARPGTESRMARSAC